MPNSRIDRELIATYELHAAQEIAHKLSLSDPEWAVCESSLLQLANRLPTSTIIRLNNEWQKRVWKEHK